MMLSAELLDAEPHYGAESLCAQLTSSRESESRSPSNHLGSLILSVLTEPQGDGKSSAGQNLVKYLTDLSPDERSEIISHPQVQHYLHRLVQHAKKYDSHDEIMGKLVEYFPNKVAHFREKKLPFSYSYSDLESSSAKSVVITTPPSAAAPTDRSLFQYDPTTLAATFRASPLKLEDMRRASFAVGMKVQRLEKAMYGSEYYGPSKRNLSVGWNSRQIASTSVSRYVKPHPLKKSDTETSADTPKLIPVLKAELNDPHFKVFKTRNSLFPQKQLEPLLPLHTSLVGANGLPIKNAFDVIEAFASGQFQAESESVYLNYAHNNRCSPYDLSVTVKTKVMPEHFVISNFGIIHVYPDGMSDFQTFADWLREASMFTLMRQITFFREYKLKRAFWQWHKAVKSAKLHRVILKINKIGIRYFPAYADALLKLKHLSEELMTIPFHHLKRLGGYSVDVMEHSLHGSQTKAEQFLFKYFRYCSRIVCGAIDFSNKHASELEAEHHHQHFVPEIPLSIQRKKYEKLEKDLEAATYQRERIGDFVCLAEQMVYSCLLKLGRQAADSWKELFLFPIPKQASSGFQIPVHSPIETAAEEELGSYFILSSLEIDESGIYFLETVRACDDLSFYNSPPPNPAHNIDRFLLPPTSLTPSSVITPSCLRPATSRCKQSHVQQKKTVIALYNFILL